MWEPGWGCGSLAGSAEGLEGRGGWKAGSGENRQLPRRNMEPEGVLATDSSEGV